MLRAFATMSRPTRAITILRPQWLNLSVASCPSPFPVASAVRSQISCTPAMRGNVSSAVQSSPKPKLDPA